MLALAECKFVMRRAEGFSITKLCMAVHSADPLLYLQEILLPEHSGEEGGGGSCQNEYSKLKRGFHQLTNKVFYFPPNTLPLLSSLTAGSACGQEGLCTGKDKAEPLLLTHIPAAQLQAPIVCKLHLNVHTPSAAESMVQRGDQVRFLSGREATESATAAYHLKKQSSSHTALEKAGAGGQQLQGTGFTRHCCPTYPRTRWPRRAMPGSRPPAKPRFKM